MPLQILSRPIVEIDANNLSKWNASFSPIIYTGIRRDVVVTAIYSGSNTSINVNWSGSTFADNLPAIGEFIYLCAGPYDGAFKVLSSSTTLLILETPFISQTTNGFINLNSSRPNYHVSMEVFRIVDSAYQLLTTQVFRTKPDGTFSFDVSALLKSAIKFINDYNYMTINKRVNNVSGGFNFRYKEVWGNSTVGFSNFDEKDVTYYIGAARQLRDRFGSNLSQYVPNPGTIALFNGDFSISDPVLDRWSVVDSLATSVIINNQLLYSSQNNAGVSTWTSDTELVNGLTYEVIVDKEWILLAEVFIVAGTNEVKLSNTANKEKITITANGTAFKIRFNSTVGAQTRQAQLNDIQVYLSEVPQLAKFLVDDFEPTYFAGYPFDLPFIHSDNLVDLVINRNRQFLDVNGAEISQSVDALDTSTNDFAVNRMLVDAPPAETKCINVWLDADAVARTGYVDIGYVGNEGIGDYTSGTQGQNPTTQNPQTIDTGQYQAIPK